MEKIELIMSETSPEQNIITNDGRFIIPVMDHLTESPVAKTEDGITDGNINLKGPSNSRTVVNSVETVKLDLEAAETP